MTDKEYSDAIRQFHKETNRHILVIETDLLEPDTRKAFAVSDRLRKAGNELVAVMRKNLHQLMRTKRYRKLRFLYGNAKDKDLKKSYAKQLAEMQATYNVTWDFCRKSMIPIAKKYNVNAVFGLTKAEDVWHGVEKCLYGNGKALHFAKYGDYPALRAKQTKRGIPVHAKNGELRLKLDKTTFGVKLKSNDRFQQDELDSVLKYMQNPDNEDMFALNEWLNTGKIVDIYRPCYATLVPKKIRGRYRVFLHLCIEGEAMPKFDRYGNLRHKYGAGTIGADIGTQTVAYTSETKVGLKNLAERGQSIAKSERQERILYRAMDRFRRATNPQNYNDDGTIKKGKKVWHYSKRYKKLKYRHAELCRKNAENRRFANNEDANYLRSLGDVFITEPKNASKLAKKAKKTTVNEKTGKFNKKKRFGKSIKNRCPGYFQAKVQQLFESTGGLYIEVPNNYRASQYDHTADDYIKKKLSQRMFKLTDGTEVQRDWYSSFLLYCYSFENSDINKSKCIAEFPKQIVREKALIEEIKAKKIKVLNSGIKIAA
ncbi:hypothetical protein ACTNDZ_10850 [Selenomonas montiformis]|uniref:hypothetical protein n=1 Tax=Selenomonas montiformis TaxID=2652285 RepID=UPI003F8AFAF5